MPYKNIEDMRACRRRYRERQRAINEEAFKARACEGSRLWRERHPDRARETQTRYNASHQAEIRQRERIARFAANRAENDAILARGPLRQFIPPVTKAILHRACWWAAQSAPVRLLPDIPAPMRYGVHPRLFLPRYYPWGIRFRRADRHVRGSAPIVHCRFVRLVSSGAAR